VKIHQSCGAIKSAIDHVKLGDMTSLLTHIKPAFETSKDFKGKNQIKNVGAYDNINTGDSYYYKLV
jgi:carbonic anhydrase